MRCDGVRVWTRSLTRPVSRTVRLSTGDSAGAPGLFCVDADTAPFRSEDATPGSCVCVRVCALLAGSGGPASRARFCPPHLFLWPFLVLSLSARPPPGWGCPACGYFCFFCSFFFAPPLSPACRVFRPWVPLAPPPLLFRLSLPPCLFPLFSCHFSFSFVFFFFFLPCCAGCAVRCAVFFFYVDQFKQSSGPGHHPMLSTLVGGITYKRGGKVAGHGSCMVVVCKVSPVPS